MTGIHRRILLQAALALPLLWLRPAWSAPLQAADTNGTPPGSRARERILLLVELHGGNDGLNTVIPYEERAYYQARPQLAIPRDQVRQLTSHVGVHPALSPLMPLWEGKELAWVQGVGYPAPNRSHFRSIEIWETASDSEQVLEKGWLSGLFEQYPLPARFTAEGILLGKGDAGPLAGGRHARLRCMIPHSFSIRPVRSHRCLCRRRIVRSPIFWRFSARSHRRRPICRGGCTRCLRYPSTSPRISSGSNWKSPPG